MFDVQPDDHSAAADGAAFSSSVDRDATSWDVAQDNAALASIRAIFSPNIILASKVNEVCRRAPVEVKSSGLTSSTRTPIWK